MSRGKYLAREAEGPGSRLAIQLHIASLVTTGNALRETRLQWISFFLRKTLFDFIKSCAGRIDLKVSGVALLGLLYSPKWKEVFLAKERYLSLRQALHFELFKNHAV